MFAAIPADTADWARPLYERQIAVLGRLAEAGLDIALEIERQVMAADAPADPVAGRDAVLTFAKVSRAVRLSLMLQARLIKDLEARDRHGAYLASCAADRKRARVAGIVERIAQVQDLDEDQVERLVEETAERLDQDDLYGEMLSRPIDELIAVICKDLGLALDWPQRIGEAAGILRPLSEGGCADRPAPS